MKTLRAYTLGLVLASVTLLITSCGGGGSSAVVAPPNPNVAVTASYKVEYIPGTPVNPAMGKTTFQIKVTNLSDGTPGAGLPVSLAPMMHMTVPTAMTHSTPVDLVSESTTTHGTYDCTVYYIMASAPGDTWDLNVIVNGETATFYPTVATGDAIPKLKGQTDDVITKMTGTETRTYFLLKDGPTTTTSISLFVAAQENMKMSFSQVYSGATFTNELGNPWPITSVSVEASTTPSTIGSWQSGTNTRGHWTVPIPALSTGQTTTVYVRLTVNGMQKSTDGLVTGPTNTNGYQTLVVTEGK